MANIDRPARRTVGGALGLLVAAAAIQQAAIAQPGDRANGVVKGAKVRLVLKLGEFSVNPYVNAVPKGRLTITVLNKGKVEHELLIVKAKRPLPMKGKRVNEVALERKHQLIGEISEVRPGRSASKVFVLKAGSYAMFCNIPGHYGKGMRASLVVRGR